MANVIHFFLAAPRCCARCRALKRASAARFRSRRCERAAASVMAAKAILRLPAPTNEKKTTHTRTSLAISTLDGVLVSGSSGVVGVGGQHDRLTLGRHINGKRVANETGVLERVAVVRVAGLLAHLGAHASAALDKEAAGA